MDSQLESVWVCCGRYKYQTCLTFVMTVTDPLSPLPTNIPVSGFLRPPQIQIYTILCCLRHPAYLNPRNLYPRPQQKSPITVSVYQLLVPGGLRKPQTSLRPSRYIPNRIRVETDHKYGLITS